MPVQKFKLFPKDSKNHAKKFRICSLIWFGLTYSTLVVSVAPLSCASCCRRFFSLSLILFVGASPSRYCPSSFLSTIVLLWHRRSSFLFLSLVFLTVLRPSHRPLSFSSLALVFGACPSCCYFSSFSSALVLLVVPRHSCRR